MVGSASQPTWPCAASASCSSSLYQLGWRKDAQTRRQAHALAQRLVKDWAGALACRAGPVCGVEEPPYAAPHLSLERLERRIRLPSASPGSGARTASRSRLSWRATNVFDPISSRHFAACPLHSDKPLWSAGSAVLGGAYAAQWIAYTGVSYALHLSARDSQRWCVIVV